MRSICLVGDSHTSALKHGWRGVATDFPDLRLTFRAMSGRYVQAWNVACRSLILDETARQTLKPKFGETEFSIGSEFDGYLICGLRFGISVGNNLFKAFRIGGAERDGRPPISDECARCTLRNGLRSTRSNTMLDKLRQITGAPIGIVPTPMRGENWTKSVMDAWDCGEHQWARAFESAAQDVAKEWGVSIFLQPAATLASPLKTKAAYCKGDSVHMNADFGAEVLRHSLAGFIRTVMTSHGSAGEHAKAVTLHGENDLMAAGTGITQPIAERSASVW